MKAFPVKFEIVDEALGDPVGKVSMFHEGGAEVEIGAYIFNLESWRIFSERVESCLRLMDLEVGE